MKRFVVRMARKQELKNKENKCEMKFGTASSMFYYGTISGW
jgi:hypothetical protein